MKYSLVLVVALLSGCKAFAPTFEDCGEKQAYQSAQEVAPLGVPDGLDFPNTRSALKIPAATAVAAPSDGRCLDAPPKYRTETPPAG